jgi:hypothetical protein
MVVNEEVPSGTKGYQGLSLQRIEVVVVGQV